MSDVFSPEKRSDIMRRVKSKNTRPELFLRSLIHSLGYRYRLHSRQLPGSPDIVFIGKRKVIFIHGCFWHGHHCKRGNRVPKTNVEYWRQKIAKNKQRDTRNIQLLVKKGWRCLVVWECEIKLQQLDQLIVKVTGFLEEVRSEKDSAGPDPTVFPAIFR